MEKHSFEARMAISEDTDLYPWGLYGPLLALQGLIVDPSSYIDLSTLFDCFVLKSIFSFKHPEFFLFLQSGFNCSS